MGDVSFRNSMIELTRNDGTNLTKDSKGRVWYPIPVPLWDEATGEVTSFNTTFSFNITDDPASKVWGDGMAFFLARFSSNVLDKGIGGGFLGLFNYSNYLNATGDGQVVAAEFDTFLNDGWESSDQHVGIDVNSIQSVASVKTSSPPGIKNRTSDSTMTATVSYENGTKMLAVDLQIDGSSYRVNATVDLKKCLPEEVAVGFTASTGSAGELHRILSWTFSSTLEAKRAPTPTPAPASPPPPIQVLPTIKSPELSSTLLSLLKILVPVAFVLVVVIVVVCLCRRQKKRRRIALLQATSCNESDEEQDEQAEFEKGVAGPRRYLYCELIAATGDFAVENMLGKGGFGSVYMGHLLSSGGDSLQVAIKKLSLGSSQGRKEFEAEVKIISRLRHRNLVQLIGWCDSRKGLLLVYELVPQGNLDRHIHNNTRLLTWPERYNITLGLGSALHYLHHESEQCVVHGDIKPSNIMLDSSYNTKLGDFGLARLVDHGNILRTTMNVQGTAGYIDPEFVNTGRPSTESDVYSFGVVLLEIVSGRRPVTPREEGIPPFMLLKWVWSLYNQGATLDAVDPRLRAAGDDDAAGEQWQMERALVVGLWCAHADPAERPSVAQAMHALQSEDAALPVLTPLVYTLGAAPVGFAMPESGGFVR
ncbi:unnamed protein product [Urochloa humidicola]